MRMSDKPIMSDPKPPPAETPATPEPLRLLRVRGGIRAGSLNAYMSEITGEKQGVFKGGAIQKG